MNLVSIALTLLLVMDPLGNIPNFMAALKSVPEERRLRIILRECLFALGILLAVFLGGRGFMAIFHLSPEALQIAGGIMLFLIALRMIFPPEAPERADRHEEEPFIVPLATPMIAGPSLIATIMILRGSPQVEWWELLAAIGAAWISSTLILLSAPFFARILRRRGLMAVERLMGMLLIVISVQMFMNGLHRFLGLPEPKNPDAAMVIPATPAPQASVQL